MSIRADIKISRAPLLGFIAIGLVWAGISAQIPDLKAQIGASDADLGLISLVASLGALSAMWVAPVFDRMFGAASAQMCTAIMAVALLVPGFAHSIWFFTLGLMMVSAGTGIADVLLNARISEIESAARRSLMNLNHAIFSFAYAGAAVLTGFAREAGLGPVTIFAIICAAILLMCLWMRAPHRENAPDADIADRPVARGIVWIGGLVVMAALMAEQATEGWSALHLERTLGAGAAEGSFGPAVLGLTMGFGRLFGHGLAARVRDTVMITIACLISAAGLALAAFAPNILVAYFGFGIMGLGISVVMPLALALVGRTVPPDARVHALSRASLIGYGAYFIGPAMFGFASEAFSLSVAFLLVSVWLVLVAAFLVPLLARRVAVRG